MKRILGIIIVIIVLSSCGSHEKTVDEVMGKVSSTQPCDTVKRIERVFMHTPDSYSFLARNNNDDTLYMNTFGGSAFFIPDVPDSLPMWTLVDRYDEYHVRLFIHIHAPSDINGAGWVTGGKYSRNEMTSVVE